MSFTKPKKQKKDKYNSEVKANPDDWWYSLKTKTKVNIQKFQEDVHEGVTKPFKTIKKAFKGNKKP